MQKVFSKTSRNANSIDIYLNRLKSDSVVLIEATENDFKELPLFQHRTKNR